MGIDPTDPHGLKYAPVTIDEAPAAPVGTVNPPAPVIPDDAPTLKIAPVIPDQSPQVRGSEPCTFEEFMKVDLRVGTIRSAERVPKSDKLLKLQVSFGNMGDRQILAGIGKSFQPEDLVGGKYVFVVNLPPRKMMGLESHGMILATGAPDALGLLVLWGAYNAVEGCRFG